MTDPATGLSVLHVIIRAGATNSQYNEHCLPVLDTRRITVCSLFPADVEDLPALRMIEGDGTKRGCWRALRKALDAGPYDVVHVHAPASGVLTIAAYLRGFRSRKNLVFTVHNSWANFRRRNRLFLRAILWFFPLVVLCGQAAFDSMPRRLRKRHADKLRVVPNGIDVDRIDKVLANLPPEDHERAGNTAVSVNRLIPIKDPDTLLESFVRARRPGDHLVIVGDGPLRADLTEAVREAVLTRDVTFTGIVERDEVYRILARSDVCISTSTGEGLPVAVLEAMGCGCPVVASDIPPHREIAERARGVRLVPVGDARAFGRELASLLQMSETERRKLGDRMRSSVSQHFSVRAMNDAYGEVYMNAIENHSDDGFRPSRFAGDPGRGTPSGDQGWSLMSALRRRLWLVVLATVLGGLAGYGFAHVQTPEYKGQASVLVGGPIGAATDEDTLKASASLATSYADLCRRESVLGPVAALGFADNWRDLQNAVHPQTGDKNPQLVQISAYADTGRRAGQLATAVADQLIRVTTEGGATPQERFLQGQLDQLEAELTATSTALTQAQRQLADKPGDTALQSRVRDLQSTLLDLQSNYTDMHQQFGSQDVGQVRLVESAWVTRSPLRPTPQALVVAGAAIGFALVAGWTHLRRPTNGGGAPLQPQPARPLGPARRPSSLDDDPEPWAEPEPLRDINSKKTGKAR